MFVQLWQHFNFLLLGATRTEMSAVRATNQVSSKREVIVISKPDWSGYIQTGVFFSNVCSTLVGETGLVEV